MIDPPRTDDETNPAVADQLALICDQREEGRVIYGTFKAFLSNRPLR